MTSGYKSNGVDLDTIFAPLGAATPVANVGYKVAGVDLSQRYAPRTTTPVPATGFLSNGVDLNQIFGGASGTGFSYRFIDSGGEVIFKQTAVGTSGPFPNGTIVILYNDGVNLREYAYTGGIRAGNISSDTSGITYISGIDIPATIRNNIDTLWNDLDPLAFPTVTGQIASGGWTYGGSPPAPGTISVICDANNLSMASFVSTAVSFGGSIFSLDSSNNVLSSASFAVGDTEGLWTAMTNAATLSGLYTGSNKVMIAPIVYSQHGTITYNGSPNTFSPCTGENGLAGSSGASYSYSSPTLLIERF